MNQARQLYLLAFGIILSIAGCKKDAYVSINGFPILESTSSVWEIEKIKNGCAIVAYLGNDKDIIVPTKVDDFNVLELKVIFGHNNYSFVRNKEIIQSVDLRSAHHLKTINHSVFSDFKNLERVWCNDSLLTIGDASFGSCGNLTEFQFSGELQIIYNNAFKRCSSLQSVNLNGRTMSIGLNAFKKCSNLKKLEISNVDVQIKKSAFEDCTTLKSVKIDAENVLVEESVFRNCRLLSSVHFDELATKSRIGSAVFAHCSSLREVILPLNIDTIHSNTFENCASLPSFYMPRNVKYVGKEAFLGCEALTSIDFGDWLKHIDSRAFYGCKSIDSLICGSSLFEIGEEAFRGCTSLDYVYFNNDLQHVKENAFYFTFINKIYIERKITPYTAIYDVLSYRNVDTICFSRGTRYPTTGFWQYLDVEWVAY